MGARIDKWIFTPHFVAVLHAEDRLQKRDHKEQTMAAAMRKFNKEQEEKKNTGSGESNRGGRNSGRGRGNNNTFANPAVGITENPNSSNYKGDGDKSTIAKSSIRSYMG